MTWDQEVEVIWLASFQEAFDACKSSPETCSTLAWDGVIEWKINSLFGANNEVMFVGKRGSDEESEDGFQVSVRETNSKMHILVTDRENNVVDGSEYLKEWMSISVYTKSFHKSEEGIVLEKYGQFYWIQESGEVEE